MIEKKEFKTTIAAPRERVWDVLWGDNSYIEWTSVFSEGSHVKTDWQEGSKVYFLNGNDEGMVALIQKKIPHEFMSFKHIGVINKGVEDYENEEVLKWAGSTENYSLKSNNGKTELIVEMDIDESYMDYFEKTWPKAMQKLKEMAEDKTAIYKSQNSEEI